MRRLGVSPTLLLLLGLSTAVCVLRFVNISRKFEWDVLIPMTTGVTIVSYLATLLLFRYERLEKAVPRDHARQLWMVYPIWLFFSMGLFGGHVAFLLIVPFFSLSGVVFGNLVANVVCRRGAF